MECVGAEAGAVVRGLVQEEAIIVLPWWLLVALKNKWLWIGLGACAVAAVVYVKVVPWVHTRYLRQQQQANTDFLKKVETAETEIAAKDKAIQALSTQIQVLTKKADAAHAQFVLIAKDRDKLRLETDRLGNQVTQLERDRAALVVVTSISEGQSVLKKAGW
jgi:septal ring factor EnvC (AmiA/AmiB activator)